MCADVTLMSQHQHIAVQSLQGPLAVSHPLWQFQCTSKYHRTLPAIAAARSAAQILRLSQALILEMLNPLSSTHYSFHTYIPKLHSKNKTTENTASNSI